MWVHSHVDDKERRERKPRKGVAPPPNPKLCACGGDKKGHCIPSHHAHVGNDLADSLAEGGKHMKKGHLLIREASFKGQGAWADRERGQGKVTTLGKGGSQQLHRLAGEDRVVLRKNREDNQAYQGGIRKALKQVCQDRRARGLEEGISKRGRAWEKARELGEEGIRRKLCRQKEGSDRFRVRAWADVLPNYKGIAQKAGAGGVNPYREMYGEAFTGECQCCEGGHIEDSAHVFQHCAGGAGDRGRMVRSVDYLWREAGLGRAWDTFRWVQEEGGEDIREYVGWEEWWGHVGHDLREGIEGIEQFCEGGQGAGRVKELALATGKITMAYAEQAWTQRVKTTLAWEQETGIGARKREMGIKGWRRQGRGGQGRKGRRKPDGDLTPKGLRERKSREHRDGAMAKAIREHGKEQGGAEGARAHKEWLRERRLREWRSREWGTQLDIRGWASPQGPDRERWRQALHEARGGHGGGMSQGGGEWRVGARERVGGGGVGRHVGRCTYGDCGRVGVRAAWGCATQSDPDPYLRCEQCAVHSCRSKYSMCQCMAEQPPRLIKKPRVKKADKLDHMVEQHERYLRRDRRSPVWIRVKRAGQEGEDVVGRVQCLVRYNKCRKKYGNGGWRAVVDNPRDPHPGWSGVKEVYMEVGEEEVQVTLNDVEWEEVRAWEEVTMGRWGGGRELESPAGSDEEGEGQGGG